MSSPQARRLLLAVALIANPEFIALDEPSSGLDPSARYQLWSVISAFQDAGRTVLMSTHDMDEAAKLCNRVAVIVAGKIVALGSPDELTRAYGSRSTVSFTVPTMEHVQLVRAMADVGELVFEPQKSGVRVRVVTDSADDLVRKATFNLGLQAREFSVQHGTLEDAFLDLARSGESTSENGADRAPQTLK